MSGEKTEQPTQRRLGDRRKEGQIPQRKNVVEAALLTFTALLLAGTFRPLASGLLDLSTIVFSSVDRDFDAARAASFTAAMKPVWLTLGICAAASLFTLAVGLLVNNFNFAPKALAPKFQKFNPVSQIKNIFSKTTLYNFARMLVYFMAVVLILYLAVWGGIEDAINASYCGVLCLFPFFLSKFTTSIIAILIVLTLMAALDYRIQTRLFISQNKMTKDEVKREFKGQEGDPEIKANRRSIVMNDAVMPLPSEATHVVHSDQVLVALIFYPAAGQRPYVVYKANGAAVPGLCRKFRALKIPTVNLPAAALELYRMGVVGQYMPARSARPMEKVLRATLGQH